jgi:hypothetical protein
MYTCERCGTRFGARWAEERSCPRCLAREGVRVRLAFRLFEDAPTRATNPTTLSPPEGLEAAVQRQLASGVR